MKSYGIRGSFLNLKYLSATFLKTNSVKIIFLVLVSVLALLTGTFSAVKCIRGEVNIVFSDFGLKEFVLGNSGSGSMFFQRMGSIIVMMFFLTVLSLHSSLFFIGGILIVYRTFLLGLNVTFIIVLHGLSGIITALLIIFPLQLLMIVLMIGFFVLARDRCYVKSKYGKKSGPNLFLLLIVFLVILALLNLVETLLLFLTSAKIILVI